MPRGRPNEARRERPPWRSPDAGREHESRCGGGRAVQQSVTAPTAWYKRPRFWAPAAAVAFGLVWFVGAARSPSEPSGEMTLSKFGKLPVLDGGRYKPVDSFARVR